MGNILLYLNENPGIGILIAATAVAVTIIGWFVKQKSDHKNSPHITAGGNISSGGNIIVGHSNVINNTNRSSDDIPEFHLHLYGAGSKRRIEGHIEKKDNRTLVVESIQINEALNNLNRQFTKLLPLKNLNHSDELFTNKQNIRVKVIYRTLSGNRFEYSQKMVQGNRADGLFNVSLDGAPSVKEVGNEKVEKALSQLDKQLQKANSVTGLASIRIPRIDHVYKKWVNDNQELYSIIQNSHYKGNLNAILLANNLSNRTLR